MEQVIKQGKKEYLVVRDGLIPLSTIRIYDNGGRTAGRYTVIFMDQPERDYNTYAALGMSGAPFHPQGVGLYIIAVPGRHLGKRIGIRELPEDCQAMIRREYDWK